MKTIIDAIKAELALNAAQKDALNRALDILEDVTNETSEVKQPTNSLNIPVGWKIWNGDRGAEKLPENAYFWSKGLNKWEKSWLNGRSVKGMTMVYIVPDYYNAHKIQRSIPAGHRICLVSEKRIDATHYQGLFAGWDKIDDHDEYKKDTPLGPVDLYITDKPLPDPNN